MRRMDEHQSLSPASACVRPAQGPVRAVSLCDDPNVREKYPPWQTATGRGRADLPGGGRAGRRLAQAAAAMLLFAAPAQAATTERVSVSSSGAQANAASSRPAVSADGSVVTFTSAASNLVAGDTNGVDDVFMRDLTKEQTDRISLSASGGQADGASGFTSVSRDGQIVAFMSKASNLAAGAPVRTKGEWDIYVRVRATGALEWIDDGYAPSVSEDGRYIAYTSGHYSLGWPYGWRWGPIVVYDRVTGTRIQNIELEVGLYCWPMCWVHVGVQGGERAPSLAPDASAVGYVDRDARVLDRITRVEHRASIPPGAPEPTGGGTYDPVVAAGQVAFSSYATNLVGDDTNGNMDVFVRRLPLGYSERVSIGTSGRQANGYSSRPGLSADGRYVAFSSNAPDLVADDANGRSDIFLRDLQEKTTTRVSVTAAGGEANGDSGGFYTNGDVRFGVARDAQVIAFGSNATNLVTRDTNGVEDVFVRRR